MVHWWQKKETTKRWYFPLAPLAAPILGNFSGVILKKKSSEELGGKNIDEDIVGGKITETC